MADWSRITSRGDVEDRRAFGPVHIGGLGLGGVALLLLINYLNTGSINVNDVLQQMAGAGTETATTSYAGNDSYEEFASTVLGSTDDTWTRIFAQENKTYTKPKLVLFRGATDSACGGADASVGPHYCPLDGTIYLDETFFDELQKLGGSGDVAQAYVIAHEVGHNVQDQLGILDTENTNQDSVRVELQADCFAGVWANSIKGEGVLEPGEIKEAMDAAAAVGDDRIQSRYEGRVNPETWTHGSSAERLHAFTSGYNGGTMASCDT